MPVLLDVDSAVHAAVKAVIPEVVLAVQDAVRVAFDDRLVRVPEAAELLDISESALRKRIARGAVPSVRCGRTIRLRVTDLLSQPAE